MEIPLLLLVLLLPLLQVLCFVPGSTENPRDRCEAVVKQWAEKEIWAMEEAGSDSDKWKLQDLLFFLHVPRTGGRNYNQCFLKNMFVAGQLCPGSYDTLRIKDLSKPNCSFLSTHDDYSILTMLPKAKTSIVTNMRDPTSRVLSSYEFSLEVAARFLKRNRSVLRKLPVGPKLATMSTLDIWPWKFLVPLLQHDLFARRDSRLAGEPVKRSLNIYNSPSFSMPLKEFIEHPAVHDLVHNGETYQVAGITNNSYVKEAREIRACVSQYEELGNHVLHVAKRRLDDMLYVGLTERHKESAEVFAHLVGRQVASRNQKIAPAQPAPGNFTEVELESSKPGNDSVSYEDFIDQMVNSYQRCSMKLRSTQVTRRISSFEALPLVNFTKQARKTIPGDLLARILQLNSLDFELYQHAKKLFQLQEEYLNNHAEELKEVLIQVKPNLRKPKLEEDEPEEDSTAFIVGCSVVFTLLGLYFLLRSLFWRERERERPRIATQKLGQKD